MHEIKKLYKVTLSNNIVKYAVAADPTSALDKIKQHFQRIKDRELNPVHKELVSIEYLAAVMSDIDAGVHLFL
ncbi:MAG: hypothetical protein HQ541_16205 [Mariniphaga sp.]|nr:hypothetical protein [Mariniphaga sp.]